MNPTKRASLSLRDLKSHPDTLLSLYRISRVASATTNPREAYQVVIEEIQKLFSPHAASISLISPDSGLLEKEYALGYPPNIEDLSLHVGKGLTGRVAFIGVARLATDVSRHPRYVKLIEGTRCKMAAPMIAEGQTIGVIDVDSDRVGAFSQEDLSRLEIIAAETTTALQSVWRQRQLANQSEQLNALIDVGQEIVSNLELQGLWGSITEAALKLTDSRLCALQLYDQENGEMRLQAITPAQSDWKPKPERVPLSESLSSAAVRTARQVEFPNITTPDYQDLVDVPRGVGVTSCLSTPMIYEGNVIGIINIYTRNRHRFPNDEKRLLQAFASLSAVTAENASLYARVFNSEERLRKAERLTTLGLLSAEIAHEIRNPLTVLKLLFGALGLSYPPEDPRHKDTQVIKEKINQLEEIVSKVLSFGKAPTSLFSHWSINELISDTCFLVRLKMKQQQVDLAYQLADPDPIVNGNKGQLQQVFLNLIINAADAMPAGGKLAIVPKIETRNGRRYVAIDFTDTGSGIPQEVQEKIFESFLSGKPEGTGLGLSIVKRILRSHHGDISVVQSSDQGTTMRVELPLID